MYSYNQLFDFLLVIFQKMGCSKLDAEEASRVFLAAELRGLPSHGMIRLKDYVQLWQAKRINPQPTIKIVHETLSTAVVDGDNAIGMVSASFAMKLAIEKAKTAGTGWVACRNSNHFGIAGYYSMMALDHDMIGICMTNANPQVAPTFSVSPMLGTNPIAVAIPAGKQPPFVADFSTTPIARGKLAVAEKKGEKVPLGFVQDAQGTPSDDPGILRKGGSMLTLGGDYTHGSHKGFCLASIVDIFSAVFSGANFGPYVPPSLAYLPVLETKVGEGTGHFFGAMRIDAWQEASQFKGKMDLWIETFRNAKPANGYERVLIPGDLEREKEMQLSIEGISIIEPVVKDLQEIASLFEVSFPGNE